MTLERRSFRVVGVMPDDFGTMESDVDLWIPWDVSGDRPRDQRYLSGIARLRSGVAIDEAVADLQKVSRQMAVEHPAANEGWSVSLAPLHAAAIGDTASILWLLFGSVLPPSFSVSAATRRYPVTVVLDGEASVPPIAAVSDELTRNGLIPESVIVAITNTNRLRDLTPPGVSVSGSSLREGGDRFLDFIEKELLPAVDRQFRGGAPRTLDVRTVAFTVTVTMVVALTMGVVPAWIAARASTTSPVRTGTREVGGGRTLRTALVVTQAALSLVLLVGALLFVHSLSAVQAMPLGYQPDRIVMVSQVLRGPLMAPEARIALRMQLMEAALAHPAVELATWRHSTPLGTTERVNFSTDTVRSAADLGLFSSQRGTLDYFRPSSASTADARHVLPHRRADGLPSGQGSALVAHGGDDVQRVRVVGAGRRRDWSVWCDQSRCRAAATRGRCATRPGRHQTRHCLAGDASGPVGGGGGRGRRRRNGARVQRPIAADVVRPVRA